MRKTAVQWQLGVRLARLIIPSLPSSHAVEHGPADAGEGRLFGEAVSSQRKQVVHEELTSVKYSLDPRIPSASAAGEAPL